MSDITEESSSNKNAEAFEITGYSFPVSSSINPGLISQICSSWAISSSYSAFLVLFVNRHSIKSGGKKSRITH